jgi:hypothetical protein|tara:strand:- start:24 stop:179 length:156 start_codon:yes stop_codon:yes gene_type:complete
MVARRRRARCRAELEDELEVEDANERVHEFSSRASTPPRLGRVERRARGDE